MAINSLILQLHQVFIPSYENGFHCMLWKQEHDLCKKKICNKENLGSDSCGQTQVPWYRIVWFDETMRVFHFMADDSKQSLYMERMRKFGSS